ncbi:neuropeptide F-like isoform X2 [Daphnia pulex]|uniref:neuropeptide F-like isoform X2 n=1 Tax=Daphnia pulex TaxID=6669 RepID=UPI001EE0E2AE|nr:neuropeptide F-like isoform X2 [Daphnia pulex]XP_046637786.1 neuropeptide F-like isoform X2 [Daphnia pulicaria]
MSSSSIQQFLPRSCSLAALVFLVVMVVLAVCVTTTKADGGDVMSGGEGGEMTAMADAIKYLQGLDKVYGQAARPRFGKRGRLPYFDMEDLPLHPQHAY